MYDTILIPTDGSDIVDQTIDHALSLAGIAGGTVHALYVIDHRIIQAAPPDTTEEVRTTLQSEGQQAVNHVVKQAQDAGFRTVESVRTGTPSTVILEYAEEVGIDVITIGAHGKTPREKLTSLGSVSDRVVDAASMPVFVIRG